MNNWNLTFILAGAGVLVFLGVAVIFAVTANAFDEDEFRQLQYLAGYLITLISGAMGGKMLMERGHKQDK